MPPRSGEFVVWSRGPPLSDAKVTTVLLPAAKIPRREQGQQEQGERCEYGYWTGRRTEALALHRIRRVPHLPRPTQEINKQR